MSEEAKKGKPTQLSNLISVSLAAQLATSPIVAATFEEVSVVGVFTNPSPCRYLGRS